MNLSKQKTFCLIDDELFITNDTPVFRLPQDCILLIFSHYTDVKTLTVLASVCKRWQRFVSHPFLWRSVNYEFYDFITHLKTLSMRNKASGFLPNIKGLTIQSLFSGLAKLTSIPRASPFKQLQQVHLVNLHINDITKIVRLLNYVKILACDNIHRQDDRPTVYLSTFSQLLHLEELRLHFHKPSNLRGAALPFLVSDQPSVVPAFRPSLKSLHLLNVFDFECTRADILTKYKAITKGINLRSLSLDRCNALTAGIWRHCMKQCTRQLEYLSLTGCRKSTLKETENPSLLTDLDALEEEWKEKDLEMALSDFFGALKNIKNIRLDDFVCSKGLVSGIETLSKAYKINGETNVSIRDYLDQTLFDFHIVFI
ncbi:hypothetical protein BY458DRAFT_554812 [Sporodiniella umbellata]|nr:hypothetical protein BY458DRAFT_554812 [Sporodiniella umbellata]